MKPLELRDAFFGGRINAASLYHKTDTEVGEEIKFVDVTSLYPLVNANGEYPVGHPDIITNPVDQDIHSYFGVALVDILQPYFLYHPYCHTDEVVNSHFLSVALASKRKCPNLFTKTAVFARTLTRNGCCMVSGVLQNS